MLNRIFLLGVCLFVMSGCLPRGETKSLDEVLKIARDRYNDAIVDVEPIGGTREKLADLVSNMNGFIDSAPGDQTRVVAGSVTKHLQELIPQTGYTTRPALGELLKSYRGMSFPEEREGFTTISGPTAGSASQESSEAGNWDLDVAARKLLVARTFTALAQELETTSFRVLPKGAR
ncbi:MAG: hypothetical protein KDD60_01060 [Bdellovibrionales bacterium]|nr:hypothetical protein [Bdellovibrionales bacterium]